MGLTGTTRRLRRINNHSEGHSGQGTMRENLQVSLAVDFTYADRCNTPRSLRELASALNGPLDQHFPTSRWKHQGQDPAQKEFQSNRTYPAAYSFRANVARTEYSLVILVEKYTIVLHPSVLSRMMTHKSGRLFDRIEN